jgi:hypothetical protein
MSTYNNPSKRSSIAFFFFFFVFVFVFFCFEASGFIELGLLEAASPELTEMG